MPTVAGIDISKLFGLPAHPLLGEQLKHSVPRSAVFTRHVHIASSLRPLILLLFLIALIALTVVFAVGTNVRLFQISDSGAKATWQRVHLRPEASR
ncbi:MAG TPA: hypothetical protein VL769_01935 [Acidimicrobiia bacterium]|nr:hypothetical protein [Acidimicrobiia bacterium]